MKTCLFCEKPVGEDAIEVEERDSLGTYSGTVYFCNGVCVSRYEAKAFEEDEYNRDLSLRVRDGQVGSGMKHR